MSQTFHVSRRTMSLEHTHGQPSPVRLHARCDANVKQPTDSQAGSEDGWILSTAKIPKSLDGRLPDIDYSKMKMRNLDDLNDERILMEFDEIQLHRRSALTDQIFPLELKKKTSPNSENEDVIVAAPPSDDLVTQLGGPLRLGDQVLQINDTPVYNLAQAQELLRNSGNKICVYVMRPSEKVSLSVSTPSFGTKEGICFLNGFSVNQASALQVTRDLEHHKGQQSSTILFPHTVYTTRDRLARTIELQQRLLNFKLYKNGVHSTRNNQQLLPCTASQRQDNFWNCLPSQANEYKRRSFNELLASTRNTITSSGVEPSSQWVLKRKTDGTKYITRRIIKSHNSDKGSVATRDTEVSRENTRTHSHLSRARSKPKDHTSTSWPYFTSPASAFGSRELPQTDHPVTDDELIQSQLDRLHLQPVFFRRKYSKSPKPSRFRPPGSNSKLKTSTHSRSTEPVFAVATV